MFNEEIFNLNIDNIKNDLAIEGLEITETDVNLYRQFANNEIDMPQLINEIKPQVAVPIHYGSVVGTKQDAIDFIKLLNPTINGIILMK